jgi:predicted  nucleic acid-binding Zn-ribbon protein
MIIKHQCSNCDSKFTIEFDVEECEDNPKFCPFCSSYIIEGEMEQDDDY